MALSPEDLAAIAQMIAANQSAPEPEKAAPAKATGTVAKAATIKRQLDPVEVTAGDGVVFRVVAHAGSGALYTRGARMIPTIEGKTYRSLDVAMVAALKGEGVLDQIAAAIETVNKRALLADHAPVKASA